MSLEMAISTPVPQLPNFLRRLIPVIVLYGKGCEVFDSFLWKADMVQAAGFAIVMGAITIFTKTKRDPVP